MQSDLTVFDAKACVEKARRHLAKGDFDLARECYGELLAASEKGVLEKDAALATSFALDWIAKLAEASGNFDLALKHRSEALAKSPSKTAQALHSSTKSLSQLSDPKRKKLSSAFASLLRSQAKCHAKEMYDAVLSVESELGPEHLVSQLAMLEFERLSQFPVLTMSAMEDRITQLKDALGPESIFVADATFVFGRKLGTHVRGPDIRGSIENLSECEELYTQFSSLDASRLFDLHTAKAEIYSTQSKVAQAKRSLDLAKSTLELLNPSPRNELKLIARQVYYGTKIRSLEFAEPFVDQGNKLITDCPELVETSTHDVMEVNGLSGLVYDYKGEFEKANESYAKSEAVAREHCPVNAERIAESVRLLVHWTMSGVRTGDLDKAKKRVNRAKSMLPDARPSQRAAVLGVDSLVLQKMKRYADSVDSASKAIELTGDSEPYWFHIRSRSLFLNGEVGPAIEDAKDSFRLYIDDFKKTFVFADQISALMLAEEVNTSRAIANAIAVNTKSEKSIDEAVEMTLRSKGIVSRAMKLFSKDRPETPEMNQLSAKLDRISSLIARQAADGQTRMTRDLEDQRTNVIYEMANLLPPNFLNELDTGPNQLQRLKEVLPDSAVVVEFDNYRADLGDEPYDRIVAFVIRKRESGKGADLSIDVVDVGEIAAISKLVQQRNAEIRKKVNLDSRGIKKDAKVSALDAMVRTSIWNKIEPFIGDRKHVIVCPTGELSRVGWGGLRTGDGNSFLAEKYQFTVSRSAHNVLRLLETSHKSKGGCLAVGGVAYGNFSENTQENSAGGFGKLKYSLGEAKAILESFKKIKQPAKLLEGENATVENLQEQISKFGVIHIASHGHLASLDEVVNRDRGRGFYERFPLLRSSIVLANANKGEGVGLWTGAQILKTDMDHVDLAVLSTCSSAVGIVLREEGFGLQTAVELAGARSTLSNQSSLSDSNAKKFVESFMFNWKQRHLSKGEAFREAQLRMIEQKIPVHYWQGWQLNGDWR